MKSTSSTNVITVETIVQAPVKKIWEYWTSPEHIIQWNNASDEWHTPKATNDLREGGNFVYRMEARDGSMGFDFGGVYNTVNPYESIVYTLGDDRKVQIVFSSEDGFTKVSERFDAESENSLELQKAGWQAILDNFKKYVESHL